MKISWERTASPKPKPAQAAFGFGPFTDHMFIMDYKEGPGWHNPRIIPYEPLAMEPGCAVFHYGQAVFEGMKAFRSPRGGGLLFRPGENMRRLNQSCQRMCMPTFSEEFMVRALREFVAWEKEWIPSAPGTSLYVRPFVIASESFLGMRAARAYKLLVIAAPTGSLYPEGIKPISIYVEPHYVRAVRGGVGRAKTSGNYARTFLIQHRAEKMGHAQVLWLDGLQRRYVEEVGAMNVFFKVGDELITPELGDTILPGITRDSVIQLLKHWGVPVVERSLSIEELIQASEENRLREAFGCGTAAAIAPIGRLAWKEKVIEIGEGQIGEISQRLYDTLTGIQTGRLPDEFGWTVAAEV